MASYAIRSPIETQVFTLVAYCMRFSAQCSVCRFKYTCLPWRSAVEVSHHMAYVHSDGMPRTSTMVTTVQLEDKEIGQQQEHSGRVSAG